VFTDSHAFVGKDVTTFPSHAPDIRIDYIFVRDARVIDADTVCKVVSDHFAITAEIEI
jgi:endonuclease/exonuclease/phosphatase family metal-dependent hydrolase